MGGLVSGSTYSRTIHDFNAATGQWTTRAQWMPYWVGAANTLRHGFDVYFFYWRNVLVWNGTRGQFTAWFRLDGNLSDMYECGAFPLVL